MSLQRMVIAWSLRSRMGLPVAALTALCLFRNDPPSETGYAGYPEVWPRNR